MMVDELNKNSYWIDHLEGCKSSKISIPREKIQERRIIEIALPSEITIRLDEVSRGKSLNRFVFFLTAYFILLRKHKADEHTIVTTPLIDHAETKNVDGQHLFYRSAFTDKTSLKEVLAELNQQTHTHFQNHIYNRKKLVEELIIRGEEVAALSNFGISVSNVHLPFGENDTFDAYLEIKEDDASSHVRLSYDASAYDRLFAESFLRHFVSLLDQSLQSSKLPVSSLILSNDVGYTNVWEVSSESQEIHIPIAPQGSHYPLSNGQSRMWITQNLTKKSIVYNVHSQYILPEVIDEVILHEALVLLMEQYEILRTRFDVVEGEPRQFILPVEQCPPIIVVHTPEQDEITSELLRKVADGNSKYVFDLGSPPLIRFDILIHDKVSYMFFNIHHIITDEWSMDLFFDKLRSLYDTIKEGTEIVETPPKIQYKDYAVWKRKRLGESDSMQMKKFWLDQFKDEIPILDLPTDYRRKNIIYQEGKTIRYTFGKDTFKGVRLMLEQHNTSTFMVLLATTYVLLYKYSAQKRITIGTPSLGREIPELEDQLGFFVNTLPLTIQIDVDETFVDFLKRITTYVLKCFDNQFYPFDLIVSDLSATREAGRNPMFDVMVVYYEEHQTVSDSTEGFKEVRDEVSKFDHTFSFIDNGESLQLELNFFSDLFKEDRMILMAQHLSALLTQILENPSQSIKNLWLATADEKKKFEELLSRPYKTANEDQTLSLLFESQVSMTPQSIALLDGERAISYENLNKSVDKMANFLWNHYKIRNGDRVAVLLAKSEELIVAILAVMKVGATYVPIYDQLPKERVEYILSDSVPSLLITDRSSFDSDHTPTFNPFCKNWTDLEIENQSEWVQSASDLAYIIYTSGSTGLPKGVMVSQNSIVSLITIWKEKFGNQINVSYSLTSVGFDPSLGEIFLPLISGKSLRLIRNNDELIHYSSLDEAIYLDTVPSNLSVLLDLSLKLENVSVLIVGGEPFQPSLAKRLDLSRVDVYNAYGPTEATITTTLFKVERYEEIISIGKSLEDGHVLILNEHLQPQPLGVPGEIYIAGKRLARGYYGNEVLTSQSFIDHPFKSGELLYKTGDLGQWLPSTDIRFLGRKDSQVKIRGFRVELAEIEKAFTDIGIDDAIVMALEDAAGFGKLLVAFLLQKGDITIPAVREKLSEKLVPYMIPSSWIFCDEFPLNSNGKVDKSKLKLKYHNMRGEKIEQPITEDQKEMLTIWSDVLNVSNLGVDDNFFENGGHSLLAIQLLSRLQEIHGQSIRLDDLFKYPTVDAFLKRARDKDPDHWTTFFRPEPEKCNSVLFPPILGLSGVFYPLAEKLRYKANIHGVSYSSSFSKSGDGILELASKYAKEIQNRISKEQKLILIGYSFGGILAFEVTRQLEKVGYSIQLIMLDTISPKSRKTLEENDSLVEYEISLLQDKLTDGEIVSIREQIRSRNSQLNAYSASGKINASILAYYTASNEKNMAAWRSYTLGSFSTDQLVGGHSDVLNSININRISDNLN